MTSQSEDEFIESLAKQGVPRTMTKWLLAYSRAGNIDYQEIDLAAHYDKTLSLAENKTNIRNLFPLSNADKLAKENWSEFEDERQQKEINERYIEDLNKQKQEQLEQLKQSKTTERLDRYSNTMKLLINNVACGHNNALILQSNEGGLAKSHTCLKTLVEAGLNVQDYAYLSGYSTPLQLYKQLWENKDKKVIVMDDCPILFQDTRMLTILKNATWSVTGQRLVSWATTSKLITPAPKEFELKAGIIVITNEKMHESNPHADAVLSRCLFYQIRISQADKIQLITDFTKLHYNGTTALQRDAVRDFIIAKAESIAMKDLNFRLIIKLYGIWQQFNGSEQWRAVAESILRYDDELLEVKQAIESSPTIGDAVKSYIENTGHSRSQFFRLYREYRLLTESA